MNGDFENERPRRSRAQTARQRRAIQPETWERQSPDWRFKVRQSGDWRSQETSNFARDTGRSDAVKCARQIVWEQPPRRRIIRATCSIDVRASVWEAILKILLALILVVAAPAAGFAQDANGKPGKDAAMAGAHLSLIHISEP